MKSNLNLLAIGILLSLASANLGQPVITTQPQSSTDVAGTATNTTMSALDSVVSEPQRSYRVLLLP